MQKALSAISLLTFALCAPVVGAAQDAATAQTASAADTESNRIASLEARIEALEAELQQIKANQQSASMSAPDGGVQSAANSLQSVQGADDFASLAATEDDNVTTSSDANAALAAPVENGAASGGGMNAFNPAISVILNGSYTHHSLDLDNYVRAGFPLVGEGAPSPNGFSLGESELSLAANIDDKLYGQLTLTAHSDNGQDQIGVEEAFIDTTALPNGFSLRAGRFFSNIGYLNSHHTHTDNFFDRPLAYQAFLGGQFGDDGVQLRWVAPTALFLEFGGEVFRGNSYPSGGAQNGGLGARTLFAHLGGDAGPDSEWLAGVSVLKSRADHVEDGFSGDSTLYIADGTWKWAPQGNFKDGGITLRSEYFQDHRNGTYTNPENPLFTSLWSGQSRGAYLEAVYRLNRTWDLGYRYDKLWADNEGPFASTFDPDRHSAELTWRNSEFSLVRLQLSHDKPNAVDSDNAITLQYQTAIGAHGAHKF